jgi:hypothetical protein
VRWPGSRSGASRRLTQPVTITADSRNVTASVARVRYGFSTATTAAPATKPTTWLAWKLMLPMADPTTNLSPVRTSGSSADRAEVNGAPSSTVKKSSPHRPANGMLGMAISATSPARIRSQAIITRRRGNRSASPASSGPPAIGGR